MSTRLLPLLGVLLLSASLAQTPTSPALSPERELLERVAAPQWGSASARTTVLVRQVPADLGINLPQNSRVVGSVRTTSSSRDFPDSVTVYFDTRLTPAQVSAYFSQTLVKGGWKAFPAGGPETAGGFLPSTPASGGGGHYYREPSSQRLLFQSRAVGGVTWVVLTRTDDPDLSQQLRYAQDERFNPERLLPKLTPPAGATVSPRGGGGGGDNVTQYASIESTLPRKALFDHYAAQLRQAGWTLQNRADTGTLTSSLWTFKRDGKEQVGLLLLGDAGRGQYRATLGIQGLE